MKKEKIKRIARRITAFAAAVAMAATFTFPAEIGNGFFSGFGNAIVASAASVSLDLANGSIVITDTGYSVGGSAETAYTGDYVIAGSCGANTGITVSGTQNITLDNVTINSDGVTPFKVLNGANVTVNLVGSNAFGNGWDGVHTTNIVVEDNASLTFVGSGSLSCCESCEHNKMLIGNNAYVTIGASAAVVLRAAGAKTISGSGTLSIDGGTIKLRSDDYFTDGSIFENSVKVKVSSGTLEIYEKTGSNGFGAESVTLNGGALDISGGIEVVGTAVVNTNAVVSTNFEIPAGSTFTVSENGVLTISEQGKLTNNGTFENYGTVKNSGEIVNNTTVTGSGKILNENGGTTSGSGTYSTTPVTIGTDFLITPTNSADTLV